MIQKLTSQLKLTCDLGNYVKDTHMYDNFLSNDLETKFTKSPMTLGTEPKSSLCNPELSLIMLIEAYNHVQCGSPSAKTDRLIIWNSNLLKLTCDFGN